MKGLFIKDIKLLRNQKKMLAFAVIMFVIFMLSMDDSLFVVNYITFFGAITALGTLSYDEFNNGLTFLFTLPVSRRQYVLEKYLFCLIMGACIWLVALAASTGFLLYKGTLENLPEVMLESVSGLILVAVMVSVILPLQIKLGQEKSRTGIYVIAGVVALVFVVLKLWVAPTDEEMNALLSGLQGVSLAQGMTVAGIIALVILVISYFITTGIITRKEY